MDQINVIECGCGSTQVGSVDRHQDADAALAYRFAAQVQCSTCGRVGPVSTGGTREKAHVSAVLNWNGTRRSELNEARRAS